MRTNFYLLENGKTTNNLLIAGDTINKVLIYSEGVVLFELEQFQENVIKEKIDTIYDGTPEKIYLKNGVKKAIKLNLNRSDNFYIKNPDKHYNFDAAYNFYINVNEFGFTDLGDILAFEHDGEKDYLHAAKLTLPAAEFKRHKIEKIYVDNYKLLPGEKFSSFGYGCDKEHACIHDFVIEKDKTTAAGTVIKAGKGILKKWFENETVHDHEIIVAQCGYSKIEKDDNRLEIERIAELMTEKLINKHISHFDVTRLIEVLNISIKG